MGRVGLYLLLALAIALTALALLAVHQWARPPLAVRLYADAAVVFCWLSGAAYGVTRHLANRDERGHPCAAADSDTPEQPAVRCTTEGHPQAKPRWSSGPRP
ncbi:hypothetical protein [Streptomyces albipurpureus]|uniref:Uncharacterized protein n=1 Tax=Streptomyces albipurpureus TaxID=2897419 RepID=A0ABT0UUJ4_9ACTN|nr:hypothetical protein [Streptomyces sp. CWNU-1]MCM2392086.1 hypothetical protein [Streptomyces sp. CWNU-1]